MGSEKENGVSDIKPPNYFTDEQAFGWEAAVDYCDDEIESLRQRVKIQEDAANHWFKEANEEHNRAEKLEAEIAALKVGQNQTFDQWWKDQNYWFKVNDGSALVTVARDAWNNALKARQGEPVAFALQHKNGLAFEWEGFIQPTLEKAKEMQRRHLGSPTIVALIAAAPKPEE